MISVGKLGVVLVAYLREYGEVIFKGTMPMLFHSLSISLLPVKSNQTVEWISRVTAMELCLFLFIALCLPLVLP